MWGGAAVASLAVASWVAAPFGAQAQQSKAGQETKKSSPSTEKGSSPSERASGVIIKVEPVTNAGRDRPATHRLTINTNAVWRDWARDQARPKDTGSAKKDAAEGKESIATRGEPVDRNSLVVVDVATDTRVETRFRSPTEEVSKGSKTPDNAKGSASEKPVQFRAQDLKPGLFVEVDFRHVTAQNAASSVTVIRPITPPEGRSGDAAKSK